MKIKKLKEANVNARYNPKYTAKEVAKDVKVKLDALIAELVDTYGFTVMKSATVMNVFKNEPYWAMQDMENTGRALTDRERWVGEGLNESTANSNGVYSLYNGWLKEPVRDEIPDDMMLEPELSEWRKRAEDLATIEDIDAYIDDIYKLRQESILKDGEYGRENQIFKAIRNEGILRALKDKKVELENKEMSLESLEKDEFNETLAKLKDKSNRVLDWYHRTMEKQSIPGEYDRAHPTINEDLVARASNKFGFSAGKLKALLRGEELWK